ncbi:TraR/DksA C4-type zinc finger protein [Vibrio sp. SS-MA-C1-2]|uniref:TraR/DksA C4-type zinc finger protein n=1 Tax=Vibrio sp. SS-MA-C1-2 TaxID=2908646 RepID=UPI001F1AF0E1|nr:TraR/DksA C4-type zinc finger protein [Vibrio sp. SS-MA-C1-2]UJF18770.1 TraR/DksA C4-type zinc finger protein [Vibrio sp. SS-MA-C1-2]
MLTIKTNNQTVKQYHQRLLSEFNLLQQQLPTSDGKIPDNLQLSNSHTSAIALNPDLGHTFQRFLQVESALSSISIELFGLCVDCEDEIEEERLEQDPATLRCQACEEKSRYKHN